MSESKTPSFGYGTLVRIRSGWLRGRIAYYDDDDEEAMIFFGRPFDIVYGVRKTQLVPVTMAEKQARKETLAKRLSDAADGSRNNSRDIALDGLEYALLISGYGRAVDDERPPRFDSPLDQIQGIIKSD